MYAIFNVAVESDFPLPELSEVSDPSGMPVVCVARGSEGGLHSVSPAIDWFHDWKDPDGNINIRAGREGGRHWLRFPGFVDFSIELADRRITVHPAASTDPATTRHLLLDQVIPRMLGHEGKLVLHAGAVSIPGGKTVAFVGETGSGKSTLVSSFERNGATLITDDCAMVVQDRGVARAIPNYPGVRLYGDSISAIYGADQAVSDVAQYTRKLRLVIPAGNSAAGRESSVLDAIFLLEASSGGETQNVDIRPARGMDALMKVVAQSFVLDVTDKPAMARQFQAAGELLNGNLSCYEIRYPRDHARLGEVRDAIVQELK